MPKKLLKKGDPHLTNLTSPDIESSAAVTLEFWQECDTDIPEEPGVLIQTNTTLDQLINLKPGFAFIGIQFNAFSDGRGFSLASQIRSQLNYQGDLRACGDLIPDQIASLFNCGFSSIELPENTNETLIYEYITPFSESYQTHQLSPTPLYRRVTR